MTEHEGRELPEPVPCTICGKLCTYAESNWVENPRWDGHHEEDGPWITGDVLEEAERHPKFGFLCSCKCLSHAAYNHASESDKKALDAVVDACRTISEYGYRAQEFTRNTFDVKCKLVGESEAFREAIHDDSDDPPEWLNRDTNESDLWQSAYRAYLKLEWAAIVPEKAKKNCAEIRADLEKALKL